MNILSLVMGLLLIFACTFTLSLRKETITRSVEKTYQAHMNASRKIRNSYESLCYRRLRSEAKEPSKEKETEKSKLRREREVLPFNSTCARLNLWPLIADGIEKHTDLYETAAQMLGSFYSKSLFQDQPRFEYALLNSLIEAAREASTKNNGVFLEKLCLKNSNVKQLYSLQSIYYRMLRGTKTAKPDQGYPSLIDYIVFENKKSRVCLHHASPEMLNALFGSHVGTILNLELSNKDSPVTIERLQDICVQNGKLPLSDEFLNLVDLGSADSHSSCQQVLVKQDADVCLKQKVFFPS